MLLDEQIEEFRLLIKDLISFGYLGLDGGGIAYKLPDGTIIATPTGCHDVFRWRFNDDDFVITNCEGKDQHQNKNRAFAGFSLALYVFNKYPFLNVFIHTHSPYSQAFSVRCMDIPQALHQGRSICPIPCIKSPNDAEFKRKFLENPYELSNYEIMSERPDVQALFESYIQEFEERFKDRINIDSKKGYAFIVEKHGLFVLGKDIKSTVMTLADSESNARAYLLSSQIK